MADIRYKKLSPAEKRAFDTWMKNRYGWRAGILLMTDPDYYLSEYASSQKVQPTIGPWTPPAQGGVPAEGGVTVTTPPPTEEGIPSWGETQERERGELELEMLRQQIWAMRNPNAEESQRQETIRLMSMLQQEQRAPEDALRAEYEKRWETERGRLAGQLTGASDWIQRWQLMNMRNPFAPPEPQDEVGEAQEAIWGLQGEVKHWGELAQTLPTEEVAMGTYTSGGLANLAARNMAEAERRIGLWEGKLGTAQGGYSTPEVRPPGPPAPAWLPAFAPGQVTGQPITKTQIPTPSAQLWGNTPWSAREGLGGYTEWAGGRPMVDILEHMAQMIPSAPRGAGTQRWTPFGR